MSKPPELPVVRVKGLRLFGGTTNVILRTPFEAAELLGSPVWKVEPARRIIITEISTSVFAERKLGLSHFPERSIKVYYAIRPRWCNGRLSKLPASRKKLSFERGFNPGFL